MSDDPARDSVNRYARDILDKATAGGWIVVEWNIRSPGFVVLEDTHGSTVEIRSPYGLDIPYYVEQFKARPRDRPIKVTA